MAVPVLPGWSGVYDLLPMLALLQLAVLEFMLSVIVPEGRVQLATLLISDGLVWAGDKAL